jgi:serine/threonine protein kinase
LLKIVGDRIRNRSATFLTKLIDLGESYSKYQRELLQSNRYRRGFTLPYAPPEQVKYEKYSEKTDVFSIGVMIYEFIFDIFPL